MNAIIVSDMHIGSHHFLYEDFECFLGNLSEDHELILNGDIIDNPYENLKPPHQRILGLIEEKSYLKTQSTYYENLITVTQNNIL